MAAGRRLTVLEAIALAQGTNSAASLSRVAIIRKTDGAARVIPVDLKRVAEKGRRSGADCRGHRRCPSQQRQGIRRRYSPSLDGERCRVCYCRGDFSRQLTARIVLRMSGEFVTSGLRREQRTALAVVGVVACS